MSFDPAPFAAGIKSLNDDERRRIAERLAAATLEAGRLASLIRSADPEVRSVILFGSVAASNPERVDFDIDIAIDGGDTYAAMECAEDSEFDVDIVDLSLLPPHVRSRILDTGIWL